MNIPYMSLKIADKVVRDEMHECLERVMNHGMFINGQEVLNFENKVKEFLDVDYAVAVSSGTDALYMCLKLLNISAGDEVIVPALSWYSTALVVEELGANVVFCDVKEDLTIDEGSVRKLVSPKTKAIIPVHFMGNTCDLDSIEDLGIPIIEDSSQAFGSTLNKRLIGSSGHLNCFSLNPMKSFSALGEAGLIICNSSEQYEELLALRYCGMTSPTENKRSSLNFRMDALQAAFLSKRLDYFNDLKKKRVQLVKKYQERILGKVNFVKINEESCPYGFTILVEDRAEFIRYMKENGIETKIQHDPLMSQLAIFKDRKNDCAYAESISKKIVNIPMNETLTIEESEYIIDKVLNYHE